MPPAKWRVEVLETADSRTDDKLADPSATDASSARKIANGSGFTDLRWREDCLFAGWKNF
jgi:hypothetical protein